MQGRKYPNIPKGIKTWFNSTDPNIVQTPSASSKLALFQELQAWVDRVKLGSSFVENMHEDDTKRLVEPLHYTELVLELIEPIADSITAAAAEEAKEFEAVNMRKRKRDDGEMSVDDAFEMLKLRVKDFAVSQTAEKLKMLDDACGGLLEFKGDPSKRLAGIMRCQAAAKGSREELKQSVRNRVVEWAKAQN